MKIFIIFFIVTALVSCVTTPVNRFTPQAIEIKGEYVQPSTSLVFPEERGSFKRVGITQYDEEGSNLAVGYNDIDSKIALTIYSYPAPKLISFGSSPETIQAARDNMFEAIYEGTKREVLNHKNSILIEESNYILKQGSNNFMGKYSSFEYDGEIAFVRQKVSSHLYLFQVDKNLYKYRVTYPINSNEKNKVENFINEFKLK